MPPKRSATASWSADAVRPGAEPDGQTEASAGMESPRHAGTARRDSGDRRRPVRVRPQRARARACCTAASSDRRPSAPRSSASTRARSAACPGLVKVVVKKNFVGVVAEKPWQAIQAAGKLKISWTNGAGTAEPSRLPRPSSPSETDARHVPGQLEGRGREARGRGQGGESHLSLSVSDARIDRHRVRGRRRSGRQGHDLVGDAGRLSVEEQRGDAAGPAARQRARHLQDGSGLLRMQRGRHCLVRRRASVAGRGQAGARAADAQGRDGLGELRIRVRHRRARRT